MNKGVPVTFLTLHNRFSDGGEIVHNDGRLQSKFGKLDDIEVGTVVRNGDATVVNPRDDRYFTIRGFQSLAASTFRK